MLRRVWKRLGLWAWIFRLLVAGGKWDAAAMIGFATVGGLVPLATLIALRGLIDALPGAARSSSTEPIIPWACAFAGAMLLQSLCELGRDHVGLAALDRLRSRLQRRLLEVACAIPLERFEDPALRNRLKVAGETLGNQMAGFLQMIPGLVTAWVRVFSMVAFVAATSRVAFLWIVVGAFAQALVQAAIVGREFSGRKARAEAERCDFEIRTLLVDRKSAAEVRLFGLSHLLVPLSNRFGKASLRNLIEWYRSSAWQGAVGSVGGAVGLGGACVVLVCEAAGRTLSLGQIGSGIYCLLGLSQAVESAFVQVAVLRSVALGAEDLRSFFEEAEARGEDRQEERGELLSLRLSDVGFTYFGADRPALHDVDFSVHRGERIAIVGPNGAGKTTLAKVILGLFKPTLGKRSFDRGEGDAPTFGCAFQGFLKFQTTVRDNVALGDVRRHPSDEDLKTAATGLDFAENLPDGWNTKLGTEFWEDGTDLSIGQWQRLALGRTFFRNADVAVLDEPSAALDPRAELELIRLFRETERDKTMIMISHRLGCTRFADRVICVVDGTIAEEGTHEELMRLNGVYASMYQAQRSWYEA